MHASFYVFFKKCKNKNVKTMVFTVKVSFQNISDISYMKQNTWGGLLKLFLWTKKASNNKLT